MKRIVLLLAVGCAAYVNTFTNPFIYDDLISIVDNARIRSLRPATSLVAEQESPTAGRPLVNFTFALNFAAGGLQVGGYRAVNLGLHLLCGLLLFAVVHATCGSPGVADAIRRRRDDIAFASALLWLVHPLNTEVVDYLTQRSESLMAACYLATIYAASRHKPLLAVAVCAAGMACKESMVTAPVAVMAYDRAFIFRSWSAALQARWRLYAGLAATWLVLAALMASGPRARTVGFGAGVSATTYLLNQAEVVARYFALALWPRSLVLMYGPPREIAIADVWPQAVLVLLAFAAICVLFAWRPAMGFVGVWVVLTLAPTSSVVPIVSEVGAERRMYLALAGLIAGCVAGTVHLVDRLRLRRPAVVEGALLATLASLYVAGTVQRNRDYRSALAMAETVAARWPTGLAETMVGASLGLEGRHGEAVDRLRPAVLTYSQARYFLGVELFETGAYQEAIDNLNAYIAADPRRIESVRAAKIVEQAHARLGDVAFNARRFTDAEAHYRAYLSTSPGDEKAVTNLGIALASQGKIAEALVQFRRAVELNPNSAAAQQNLARAQALAGR